jgi:hemerythrin superfamily protein
MAKKRTKELDAIELLKKDHRRVEALFKQFEQLQEEDADAAEPVIETICTELKIHDKLETELFYPAVRDEAGDEEEDLLNEAEVEHTSVRQLIETIESLSPDDEKRNAHVTVLTEYVKHHVQEEEKEMFPKVKKLEGLDLKELGAQMKERKTELMSEMGVEAEEEAEENA